ncbi:hypothetical protein CXG81DRAFT_18937 [Caulochytrium protostelioides]|uniref:Uncharacterized protein n=1 Tax=Caulochytrium protostelioides TaxID=1555241 RepID=A0A4P9X7K3_9FUNG|nr:hypothetical protein CAUPRSCDRAFT_11458 [Caulochytrium protostelioides]RKP01213.1 hypothetical protein CXG81DRAFT_18937 [Caulochytrium protostelioides]|eukprot:RKP01213.1 hypothetical protein CXG81DRAFT_18937 [Caulochytrium protostelioides]
MDQIKSKKDLLAIPIAFWNSLPNGYLRDTLFAKSLQSFYSAVCTTAVVLGVVVLIFITIHRKHPAIKTRVYHFVVMDVLLLVLACITSCSGTANGGWRMVWQNRPSWIYHGNLEAMFCCVVMSTISRTAMLYRTIQIHTPMKRLPYIDTVIDHIVDCFGYLFVGYEYRRLKMRLRLTQKETSRQLHNLITANGDDHKGSVLTEVVQNTWRGTAAVSISSLREERGPMSRSETHSNINLPGTEVTGSSTHAVVSTLRSNEVQSIIWCVLRYVILWGSAFGISVLNTRRLVGELDQVSVGKLGPVLGNWADLIACFLIINMVPLMLINIRTALAARWDSLGMVFELIWIRGALNIMDISAAFIFVTDNLDIANDAYSLLAVVLFLELVITTLWPPIVILVSYFQEYRFRAMAETTQLKTEEAMEEFYNSSFGHDMVRDITSKNYAVENFVFLEVTQKPLSAKHFNEVYRELIDEMGPWQINISSELYERWGKALKNPQEQAAVVKATRHAVFSLLITNYRHVLIKQVRNMS